ncbi:profilin family protein [Streptomyces sp. NPDC058646]|uniref:profilin family protein n=1 Tax=Streptomyces sp. NPDC058646 TaxID=3346574 RepID=UPI003648E4D4
MDEPTLYLQEAIDSGTVTRAEILHEDGSLVASVGQPLTTARERRLLAGLFNAPADAITTGIAVGGLVYTAAEADRRLLHGRHGNTGVVAAKNPPYITVGLYSEGHRPADAVLTLGNLADLLAGRPPRPDLPRTATPDGPQP